MAVDITDKAIIKYQTDRLIEKAALKTINEEVGFCCEEAQAQSEQAGRQGLHV